MAASPQFVGSPKAANVSSGTAANTAIDGSGTLVTLFTMGANGGRLEEVYIRHLGTNVATVLRFFLNGKLFHEEAIAANTLSQTAASAMMVWRPGVPLPANAVISMTIGTAVAAGLMVTAIYGEF